jgi:hypothetical protein
MCRLPAISVSVNGSSGRCRRGEIQRGDGDAPRRTLVDERQAAVLEIHAVDRQVPGLGVRIGGFIAGDALPVGRAIGLEREPHVGAFEPDAVDHQVSGQQRKQLHAQLRVAPAGHGFVGETGRIAETALAGAQRQPREELQVDVTDQRELAARGFSHRGLDARFETVRIDQQHDHGNATRTSTVSPARAQEIHLMTRLKEGTRPTL